MMPFGIFLPRNSLDQSKVGNQINLIKLNESERLDFLKNHAKPFMSIIYIGGHVMLYIGNAQVNEEVIPLTYQNIWGLKPADNSRRSIIGQSIIFPLLKVYPEDPSLQSLANKKLFIVTYLDKSQ